MGAELWFGLIALCLVMYVLLDGYDLGIGMWLAGERDGTRRRQMVDLVATAWDGNESWIVLLGVALWGGVPLAYGALLPALYIPILLTLLGLILRGVAIEVISGTHPTPRRWEVAFVGGSYLTALAQGLVIGGLLSGIEITDGHFSGGTFDFLTPYSLLTALATVVLYLTSGAGVIQLKTDCRLPAVIARGLPLSTLLLAAACVGFYPLATEGADIAWMVGAGVLAAAGLVVASYSFLRQPDWVPTAGITVAQLAGMVALFAVLWPVLVPPSMTLADADPGDMTTNFLLIGVGLNIPLVLFYNWYAHHVFRGKLRLGDDGSGRSHAARQIEAGDAP